MSVGISRVHGYAAAPSQRPSTISFFTITFPANIRTTATTTSDIGVVDGALDRIFRTAVAQFATVAMIGTVSSNGLTLNFAIEDTGTDTNSPSGLGLGNGSGAIASTVLALQGAIQSLGTVNGIALGSATVAAGVNGSPF
jgi:hypothetical protein